MSLTDAFAPTVVLVLENLQQAKQVPASHSSSTPLSAPTPDPASVLTPQQASGLIQPSDSLIPPGSEQSIITAPSSSPVTLARKDALTSSTTSPSSTPSPAEQAAQFLANQLHQEIANARVHAIRNGVLQSDFDNALFAIAAWADEKLRAVKWAGASRWNRYLLQKQYFETTTAGVEFFSRLEQIPRSNLQVQEVYALCLALSFTGKYEYERDLRSLRELRLQTLQWSTVDSSDGSETGNTSLQLFPQAYPDALAPSKAKNDKPSWALGLSRMTFGLIALPLIALIILGIAYYISLAQMTANLEAKIL